MTPDEKQAAKDNLRQKLKELQIETFEYWLISLELTEEERKHSGYSQGPEDMIRKLVRDYRKKQSAMMKPFDRGDYD